MKMLIFFLLLSLTAGIFGQEIAALTEFPAEQQTGEAFLADDMIWINGGTFTMGSPAAESGRSGNEGPQRQVTLSSFYIGRYEITQAEYQEIMGANPSSFKGQDLPVETVSWFDAIDYCNRRSEKEGLIPVYTISGNSVRWNENANGYRLPSEAEWEFACRAGSQTPFYTGTSVNEAGWHSGNSGGRTHPVGTKQPNSWGLYDMHGNVLEWCWDWLGTYSGEAQTDPRGAISGSSRVYRGGCFRFEAHQSRSAFRFGNHPNLRVFLVGLRVARSGSPEELKSSDN